VSLEGLGHNNDSARLLVALFLLLSMGILDFVVTIIRARTVSGALAPGPLFFANIAKRARAKIYT
jgi:hypothetical protein